MRRLFWKALVFYHLVKRTCFTTFSFNSKTLRNQFHTTANPNTFPAIPPSEALLSLYICPTGSVQPTAISSTNPDN